MLFKKNIFDCDGECKTTFLRDSKIYIDDPKAIIIKDGVEGLFGIEKTYVYETETTVEYVNLIQHSEFDYEDAIEEDAVEQAWHLGDYGDSSWQLIIIDDEALVRFCTGGPTNPPNPYIVDEAFYQDFVVSSDGTFELSINTDFSFRNPQVGTFTAEFIRNNAVETTVNLQTGQNTVNVGLVAGTYRIVIRYVDEIPAGFSPLRCVNINNVYLEGNQSYSNEFLVGQFLDLTNAELGCYEVRKTCGDTALINDFHDFQFGPGDLTFISNNYIQFDTSNVQEDQTEMTISFESCGDWNLDFEILVREGDTSLSGAFVTINGNSTTLPIVPIPAAGDYGVIFSGSGNDLGTVEIKITFEHSVDVQQFVLRNFVFSTFGSDSESLITEFCVEDFEQCEGNSILDIELECTKFSTPEGARYIMPVVFYAEPIEMSFTSEEYFDTEGRFRRTSSREFKTVYDGRIQQLSQTTVTSIAKLLSTSKVLLTLDGITEKLFFTGNSIGIDNVAGDGCFTISAQFIIEENNASDCCC